MTSRQNNKADKLHKLQESFIAELPQRFVAIREAWSRGKLASLEDFHRLVHSLAGSAGTFGFPLLGEHSRELEILVQQHNGMAVDQKTNAAIERALTELETIAARGVEKLAQVNAAVTPVYAASKADAALVYLLEDDVNMALETAKQLRHFGYLVEVFHSTDDLASRITQQTPDALLADINLSEGSAAGPQAVIDLRNSMELDVPVIFISGNNDWQSRLSAVRAGGQAYLSKPINYSQLIEQLDSVTGREETKRYRILIVDDTPLLAEHYAVVLQNAGMKTEVLNNPESILDVLAVFRPDLILMDIYMPECTGVEAAQVIRQHSAYTNLPIVYLSTEKSVEQQLQALHVGGDDFLQKPINDDHLVAAVRIRARRFRELSALMNRDSLTGLLNHINLKLALERELAQTVRRHSPLSFVMLDIDTFKLVNDTYGHPVGDQVIKSLARLLSLRLRKGDIAARYGGEEFALILPDTPVEEARHLIDDLRHQFAKIHYTADNDEFSSTFSAGIASCPTHCKMDDLITAADEALYAAKNGGRNQVITSASPATKPE